MDLHFSKHIAVRIRHLVYYFCINGQSPAPTVELQINTERFHRATEEYIKKYAIQLVWMHERWKTTPEMVEAKEREKQELRRKRREQKEKEGMNHSS